MKLENTGSPIFENHNLHPGVYISKVQAGQPSCCPCPTALPGPLTLETAVSHENTGQEETHPREGGVKREE